MKRMWAIGLSLALGLILFGSASSASAQAADAKRSLKAAKELYKEPGMMEVDIRAMRKTMMLTGSVPSEEHSKKAEEIAKETKGIDEVRNRLRVTEAEPAPGCDKILAKLNKAIDDDEELAQAKRRLELKCADSKVTIGGKVKDYTLVGSLVSEVKRIPGVVSLDIDELDY